MEAQPAASTQKKAAAKEMPRGFIVSAIGIVPFRQSGNGYFTACTNT